MLSTSKSVWDNTSAKTENKLNISRRKGNVDTCKCLHLPWCTSQHRGRPTWAIGHEFRSRFLSVPILQLISILLSSLSPVLSIRPKLISVALRKVPVVLAAYLNIIHHGTDNNNNNNNNNHDGEFQMIFTLNHWAVGAGSPNTSSCT